MKRFCILAVFQFAILGSSWLAGVEADEQQQAVRILEGHSGSVLAVAYSPDGRVLASCSRDKTIKIWDAVTGQVQTTLTDHTGDVYDVVFSPSGNMLASGGRGKDIKLWDAKTWKVICTLEGHTDIVRSVAFSPDQKRLVSGSVDLTVRLWDVATGKMRHTLTGHTARVMAVSFSPDGTMLVSASSDKSARLWDAKLGIKGISRQTVRNILKEEGIVPAPDRSSDKWDNFLERHKNTLWAVDLFCVKAVTASGIRNLYLLVWLCMESREAIVSSSTKHPNAKWVKKQAETFIEQTKERAEKPAIVLHDRDTKFTKEFVATLKASGVRTNALPVASPNLNGRCERFVGIIKQECLSRFILFGQRHLDFIVAEWVRYYNTRRGHVERDHLPPIREVPDQVSTLARDQIEIRSYVGGLVRSFERKAA